MGGLDSLQPLEILPPDVAPEAEEHDAAIAYRIDESGLLQFAEVVRDGGGTDAALRIKTAAGKAFGGSSDLLKHAEAPRVRQGPSYGVELVVRERFRAGWAIGDPWRGRAAAEFGE